MPGEHYSAFVEEAFLTPIRSVLIVDDDYPTFDEMLEAQIAKEQGRPVTSDKGWYKDPTRIQKVIASFRTPERPLLVDIHDGSNVPTGAEVKIAAHLHQSDLLVLDYQLDKSKPGDGSLAIEIMRSLMRSDHFNLVVVHTSEDLETVFRDTLLGLMSTAPEPLTGEELERARELLFDAEGAIEGQAARIGKTIGLDQYLHARRERPTYLRTMSKGQQPYAAFCDSCEGLPWNNDDRKLVLRHLLQEQEATLSARFSPDAPSALTWNEGLVKFIKADSVFVAFSAKSGDEDLLSELLAALNTWKPQPSRLFLAKLRAEMDEHGVVAQGTALGNQHALAHWYHRLLGSSGSARRWLISESVVRHSDQLMAGLLPQVEDFATRLIKAECASGTPDELSKEHFKLDLANAQVKLKSAQEHNAFVSSKPPEGWHLTTGHVFTIGDDYWVCVSPACDTVPAQLSRARVDTLGERLPFMAVKLHPIREGKALSDVQSNRYLFLQIDGVVKAFCFNDPSDDAAAPAWHTLYAERRGEFSEGFRFGVLMAEKGARRLVQRRHEAAVVAQLRYEYALNLVQRLGLSLTRIGLDFV